MDEHNDEHKDDHKQRDELWASLVPLLPEIERLARCEISGTERELQLISLLARVVAAEVEYRTRPQGSLV